MQQIHIDLETLGIRPTSRILSIGAFTSAGEEFYVEIDQSLYGDAFTTDTSTIEWWKKRGGFQPTTDDLISPAAAMHDLAVWMQRTVADDFEDDFEVWANSPTFDCAILRHHYSEYALAPAWSYWQERDVRTMRKLAGRLHITLPNRKTAHHALQDAKDQCRDVGVIISTLAQRSQQARDAMFLRNYKIETLSGGADG